MSTTISKIGMQIGASVDGVKAELDKVSNWTEQLGKKVKAIPEFGEKLTAGFSRINQVSSTFGMMTSGANDMEKAVAGISTSISSVVVGLQLATKVSTGLKAALIGTGIGALIVGAGWLMNRLTASSSTPAPEAARPPSRLSEITSSMRDSAELAGARSREDAVISTAMREIDSIRRARSALDGTTPGGAMMSDVYARMIRERISEIPGAVTGRVRMEGVASVGGIAESAARHRDMAATIGMSRDAAEDYALSLRRTTRTIGGITVATTEAMTPLEAHNRRLAELAEKELRTGASMADARAESVRIMNAEVAALGELRAARLAAAGAAERERLATGSERMREEMGRIGDLLTSGGTSWETYTRGVERALGDTRSPIDRARDRIDEINVAWEQAALMAAFHGETLDDTSFVRATAAAYEDATRGINLDMPAGFAALEFGSAAAISAINAARRSGPTDPAERQAALLERLRAITAAGAEDTRRIAEAAGRGFFTPFTGF